MVNKEHLTCNSAKHWTTPRNKLRLCVEQKKISLTIYTCINNEFTLHVAEIYEGMHCNYTYHYMGDNPYIIIPKL